MRRYPFIMLCLCLTLLCISLGMPVLAQTPAPSSKTEPAAAPAPDSDSEEDREPHSIKVEPITDVNPVKTQHTFVATVLDRKGRPVAGQRVEWILARGPRCVGDIVEHDDMGAIIDTTREVVRKISNTYTVTYTNDHAVRLTMGTPVQTDDITLGVGQTWITITSPVEGETHVIAFCPGIRNANNHKAFAVKFWEDMRIAWPENAVNRVGTPHQFVFRITRASNGQPLQGYAVTWTLEEEGVPAYLGEREGTRVVPTQTNEQGEASVTLNQVAPREGSNRIRLELRKPSGELLAVYTVTKEWIAPRMLVRKTGPERGVLGERVVFTIEVDNQGQADAQEVVMTDNLPEGLSYLECNVPPTTVQERQIVWNIGTVPRGEVRRFELVLRATRVGPWVNTVQVTSREAAPVTGQATIEIGAPEVFIVKQAPREVRLGQKIVYTITVKNNGTASAREVVIRDAIPAGLRFTTRSGPRTEGTPLRWDIGELRPGESQSRTYEVDTIRTGTFTNQAEAWVRGERVHYMSVTTTVVAPDLRMVKEGSRWIYLHRTITYTIRISNEGDGAARNVEVTDTIPSQLDYVEATPRGTLTPAAGGRLATIRWSLGDIPPRSRREITVVMRGKLKGFCRNLATLVCRTEEPPQIAAIEATADLEVRGVPAMHISTYDTEDPVEVGRQTIYVTETRNEGTSQCTNVTMKNLIPEEMEFITATGPAPYKYDVEHRTVVWDPVPILAPTEKLVFRIVCKATKVGSAKHAAMLKYDQFEREITDEEGTSCYK